MATPEHAPHIPHIPVPDIKGAGRWALKHWPAVTGATLTLAGTGVAAQMLFGSDRGPDTPPQEPNKTSDTFKPPEGAAVIPEGGQATVTVTPGGAEASGVTPTATGTGSEGSAEPKQPEAKVEACKILPDCSQARIVEIPINGKLTEYVDLGDQKPSTPIRSPVKGQVAKSPESDPFVGLYVRVRDLNDPTLTSFAFSGDLEVDNMLSEDVEEGQIIARVGTSGVKNFGKYKVLLRVSQKDQQTGMFITALDKLKELFQNLFSKPRDRVSYYGPIGSIITDSFLGKPSSKGK